MKLKELHIQNIASIEKADINFENDLKDESTGLPSGLFLITGETGTGKTVLLDAIALALYKTTPRMGDIVNQKQNSFVDPTTGEQVKITDISQYTRIGITSKDPSYVQLKFEGNDGMPYTATLTLGMSKISQSKADPADPNQPKQDKYHYATPKWEWTDGKQTYAKEEDIKPIRQKAIGMTFPQFCRMSMLAQGQFAEFLCGGKETREAILEQLTNTFKFSEYGAAISNIHSTKKKAVNDQEKKIEGRKTGLLKEAELETTKQNLQNDKKQLETVATPENQAAQALVTAQKGLAETDEKLKKNATALSSLQTEWAALLGELKLRQETLSQEEQALVNKAEQLKEDDYKGLYEKAGVVNTHLDTLKDLQDEKIQAESRQRELEGETEGLKKALEDAQAEQKKAQTDVDDQNKAINGKQADRTALKPKEVINKVTTFNELENNLKALKTAYATWQEADREYQGKAKEQTEKEEKLNTLKQTADALKEKKDEAETEYMQALTHFSALEMSVDKSFDKVRAQLQEGDACPLCGQHVNLELLHQNFQSWLDPQKKEVENKKEAKANAFEAWNAKDNEVSELEGTLKTLRETVANLKDKADSAHNDLKTKAAELQETVDDQLPARVDNHLENLAEDNRKLLEDKQKIDALGNEIEALQQVLQTLNQTLVAKTAATGTAQSNVTNNGTQINAQKSAALTAADKISAEKDYLAPLLTSYAPAWELDPETLKAKLEQDAEAYSALQSSREKLQKETEANERMLNVRNTLAEKYPALMPALQEQTVCRQSPELDWNALSFNLATKMGEKSTLETDQQKYHEALKDYLKEDGTVDDEAIYLRAQKAQEAVEYWNQQIGTEQRKIDDHNETEAGIKEEKEILVKMNEEEKHWANLDKYFGGTRFRTLVQTHILTPLLAKANTYLKSINDRYTLKCDSTNQQLSILVFDNDYKRLRSAAVLSGGERFMISLSLALALSDLNRAGMNVDILFIDEGFGTLDQHSLDSVIKTLEELPEMDGQKNRRVGVISHREELFNRIPDKIYIKKCGKGKSQVICPFHGEL